MSPRFQGDNLDRNLALVEALRKVADAKGVSVAQIAIAWVAAQGDDIIPLVGARRRDRLGEALGALEVRLDAADLAAIKQAVPKGAAAGDALRSCADGHARQRKSLKTRQLRMQFRPRLAAAGGRSTFWAMRRAALRNSAISRGQLKSLG